MSRQRQGPNRGDYSVRHIVGDFNGIEWTRAATKHRISRSRSGFVVEHARCCFEHDPPADQFRVDTRLMFFGDDRDGSPLEVIAVETREQRLLVIHAMSLRPHLRPMYEEARKWNERSDTP